MKKSGRPRGEEKCRKTVYLSRDTENFVYQISRELNLSVSEYIDKLLREMIYEEGRQR